MYDPIDSNLDVDSGGGSSFAVLYVPLGRVRSPVSSLPDTDLLLRHRYYTGVLGIGSIYGTNRSSTYGHGRKLD